MNDDPNTIATTNDTVKFQIAVYDEEREERGDAATCDQTIFAEPGDTALRIVLGGLERNRSNLYIERHSDHWLIFVHPNDGDATLTIRFYDDGRSEIEDALNGGSLKWDQTNDPEPLLRDLLQAQGLWPQQ